MGGLLALLRAGLAVAGRRVKVDMLIYKADRLGDWLLVTPTLMRLIQAVEARGGSAVLWAANESATLRQQQSGLCRTESFDLEPHGLGAKLRRAWQVTWLLARYRADTFVCLRYLPEPVRDFVLRHVDAPNRHALSWLIAPGPPAEVPWEIARHHWILASLNLGGPDRRELLPVRATTGKRVGRTVVIAPFSASPLKDWNDAGWAEVASDLGRRGLNLEIWVASHQQARAEALAARLRAGPTAPPVAIRTGRMAELECAVAGAAIVLSVDTFAAHVAAAHDTPLVALLGGGHYGDFAPWGWSSRQRWITHPLPCFNCGWNCIRPRVECVQDIAPTAVIAEIDQLLAPVTEVPAT